jgi:tRNA splicing ligase
MNLRSPMTSHKLCNLNSSCRTKATNNGFVHQQRRRTCFPCFPPFKQALHESQSLIKCMNLKFPLFSKIPSEWQMPLRYTLQIGVHTNRIHQPWKKSISSHPIRQKTKNKQTNKIVVATRNYIPQTWKDIGRFCSVIKEHIVACNFSFMKGGCFHNAHMIENRMPLVMSIMFFKMPTLPPFFCFSPPWYLRTTLF